MDQQTLDKLNNRIEALEVIHTRYQGPRGERGPKGDAGPAGPPGKGGRDGYDGEDGVSNVAGPAGRNGPDGVDGRVVIGQVVGGSSAMAAIHVADDVQIIDLVLPRGPQGERGLQGERGPQGVAGSQGSQGERGPTGPIGRNGVDGKDGLRGPQGKPGDISVATACAEQEARRVVQEALADGVEDEDPRWFALFRDAQEKWFSYRNSHCEFETYLHRGGTIWATLWANEAERLTRLRIADLESWMKRQREM